MRAALQRRGAGKATVFEGLRKCSERVLIYDKAGPRQCLLPWTPHKIALPLSAGRGDHEGTVNYSNVLGANCAHPATGAWIGRLRFMATLQATLTVPLSLKFFKKRCINVQPYNVR